MGEASRPRLISRYFEEPLHARPRDEGGASEASSAGRGGRHALGLAMRRGGIIGSPMLITRVVSMPAAPGFRLSLGPCVVCCCGRCPAPARLRSLGLQGGASPRLCRRSRNQRPRTLPPQGRPCLLSLQNPLFTPASMRRMQYPHHARPRDEGEASQRRVTTLTVECSLGM
jgi:hypothetical protein